MTKLKLNFKHLLLVVICKKDLSFSLIISISH